MCPATRAPTVLVLLLPLLLGPPSARGDCGLPPDVPNAEPNLQGQTSFPNGVSMTYKCVLGFVKVPGRPDSVLCAQDQWSELAEFCDRSCDVPTRLLFASLQKTYSGLNYFPVGSSVEYECREGFQSVDSLSKKISCLQNLTWSKAEEFCKKKSCPNPGEIKNGHVSVITDILYGATITFSCDAGYNLVGADSSYCTLLGDVVGWTDPLPDCKVIVCPKPPQIDHAVIQKLSDAYLYGQSVLYQCTAGFDLVGNSAVNCTAEAGHGVWSSPLPVCKETPSAGQNPVMANFSSSQTTPTAQRSTTATVSLAQSLPAIPTSTAAHARLTQGLRTTQRLTSAHVTATQRPVAPRATTHIQTTSNAPTRGPPFSRANIIAFGKSGSPAVKRNCRPCGRYSPYSWKRILSFQCLRNTIKMKCIGVPKRKQVNALNPCVLWMPLRECYAPKYSQPCKCSKVILGQLQVILPKSQILLRAFCINAHTSGAEDYKKERITNKVSVLKYFI